MTRTNNTFTVSLMELVICFGIIAFVAVYPILGSFGMPFSDALCVSVVFGVGTAGIAYSELR